MRNVLLAVSEASEAPVLFDKVKDLLGDAPDTVIHVVQVIHEGVAEIGTSAIEDSARLKTFILESAESALEDLVEPLKAAHPALESATLWNARRWEGILHAAERAEADLVVKGSGVHRRFGDVVRTPDDWNLLRHATAPVMLIKEAAWPRERVVLCALDPFDERHTPLCLALLRQAGAMAGLLHAELDIVCAYPLFEPWVGELGAVKSYAEIKSGDEEEIRGRVDVLAAEADVVPRYVHLEEGHAAEVLHRLADEHDPALLVLGTHARSGVAGVVLGNTSERILDVVGCDVMTVPEVG